MKTILNMLVFAVFGWLCGAIFRIPPSQFIPLAILMLAVLVINMSLRRE